MRREQPAPRGPPAAGQGKDDQDKAEGGDHSAKKWAGVAGGGPRSRPPLGEHQVGDHRAAAATGHLGGQVSPRLAPAEPAKGGVDEGHDRVEVRSRDGPNIKMMTYSPAAVAAAFSNSSRPTAPGESFAPRCPTR